MNDQLKHLAGKIANDLRLLADACEKLGSGTADPSEIARAKMLIEGSIDNYWHGILVGEGQVHRLLQVGIEDEADEDLVADPELQEAF